MRRLQDLTRACRGLFAQGARAYSAAPGETLIANGVPNLAASRKVFITAPAKTAAQHGFGLTVESELGPRRRRRPALQALQAGALL